MEHVEHMMSYSSTSLEPKDQTSSLVWTFSYKIVLLQDAHVPQGFTGQIMSDC